AREESREEPERGGVLDAALARRGDDGMRAERVEEPATVLLGPARQDRGGPAEREDRVLLGDLPRSVVGASRERFGDRREVGAGLPARFEAIERAPGPRPVRCSRRAQLGRELGSPGLRLLPR